VQGTGRTLIALLVVAGKLQLTVVLRGPMLQLKCADFAHSVTLGLSHATGSSELLSPGQAAVRRSWHVLRTQRPRAQNWFSAQAMPSHSSYAGAQGTCGGGRGFVGSGSALHADTVGAAKHAGPERHALR
jgi:hypothetical protein